MMNIILRYCFATVFLFRFLVQCPAQETNWQQFRKLSCPEKRWVSVHPFIAKKAHAISMEVLDITEKVRHDRQLDNDPSGGQVDAFRHCIWMARLTQEFSPRKARSLGNAHEKGNKQDFRKKRTEDGILPDAVSGEMDYRNNEVGIRIGKENPDADLEVLVNTVKKAILNGDLWKIKKSPDGKFLDCEGNLLSESDYKGKWENLKCLVPSDE